MAQKTVENNKRKLGVAPWQDRMLDDEGMQINPLSKIQRMMSWDGSTVEKATAKLFGGLPEPSEYQRVFVTETNEETSQDTIHACRLLSTCMKIRRKWISCHITALPLEPSSRQPAVCKISSDLEHAGNLQYNIFDRTELSTSTSDYQFSMRNGVVEVVFDGKTDIVCPFYSFEEFVKDFNIVSSMPCFV